ncbi:MAG: DNRLRE domain-containing protein [Xenococcaceae cyanobacterium MO_167.B27]|nr:DNRLRE domain-containing protein [Xenococcaceae cyanobacterium MO_167.B27]
MLQEASPDINNSDVVSLNVDTSDRGGAVHGLLRFENIFGNQAGQIGSNVEIVSAQLELDVDNPGDSIEFYLMFQDWSDTDTWNSLGNGIQADGIEAASTADAVTASVSTGYLSVDVTESIKAWQSDPSSNFGWAILPTGANGVDFDSAEGATKPRLVVEYKENSNPEPQKTELTWEAQGFVDEAAIAPGTVFNFDGNLTATVNWEIITNGGSFVPHGGENFVSYDDDQSGNHQGYLSLGFNNSDNDPDDLIQLSIDFNQAVTGLNFQVLDVDQSPNNSFDDGVEIYADGINIKELSGVEILTGENVFGDNETYMNGFEGRGSANSTSESGNISLNFGSTEVSQIEIKYFSTDDALSDPGNQKIGISDLHFQVQPT